MFYVPGATSSQKAILKTSPLFQATRATSYTDWNPVLVTESD